MVHPAAFQVYCISLPRLSASVARKSMIEVGSGEGDSLAATPFPLYL
jgi:hypothetical protein